MWFSAEDSRRLWLGGPHSTTVTDDRGHERPPVSLGVRHNSSEGTALHHQTQILCSARAFALSAPAVVLEQRKAPVQRVAHRQRRYGTRIPPHDLTPEPDSTALPRCMSSGTQGASGRPSPQSLGAEPRNIKQNMPRSPGHQLMAVGWPLTTVRWPPTGGLGGREREGGMAHPNIRLVCRRMMAHLAVCHTAAGDSATVLPAT